MVFELGDGKQIIVNKGRIMIWANKGCSGVELTPEMQREIGLAMFQIARKKG